MILKKIYIPALAPGGQGRDINTKCSIVPAFDIRVHKANTKLPLLKN